MMSAIDKVENCDDDDDDNGYNYDDYLQSASNKVEIKLIYYSADNTTNIIPTTFMMNNLKIKGFETEFTVGGALYFQGDIYLTLSAISFVNCTSLSGGAITIKNNNFSTLITECVFENCKAVGKLKLLVFQCMIYFSHHSSSSVSHQQSQSFIHLHKKAPIIYYTF